MPFRFFRRFRIAPGLTMNLSKRGASVSAGRRGARVTMGTSGTRATAGLTGTGLHYTVLNPHKKLRQTTARAIASEPIEPPTSPTPPTPGKLPKFGWLKRLTMASDAKQFLDGWRAWGEGHFDQALEHLESVSIDSPAGADAAWSAALLRAQREQLAQSITLLQRALQRPDGLGQTFAQFGLSPSVQVPVAPDVIATMAPTAQSARLLLAEVHQSNDDPAAALDALQGALPDTATEDADPVVLSAYGELALLAQDQVAGEHFLKLSGVLTNDSPVHTVVMYYRAQALVDLGMHHAALEVLGPALRRTKGRNPELMLNLRYLRVQVYQAMGKEALARKDLERIYAQDPGFEDVAQALGHPGS